MKDSSAPILGSSAMVRPVAHRDGRRGQCECRKGGYTITWDDGTTKDCVDISYAGAAFTDLKAPAYSHRVTPRARSFDRGAARHLWANASAVAPATLDSASPDDVMAG